MTGSRPPKGAKRLMEAQESRYVELGQMNAPMMEAALESQNSSDRRRPIGCVILQDGRLVGRGSNQATFAWGWLRAFHVKHCFRKALRVKRHGLYWLCPGCALFRNHAEARAIRDALPRLSENGIIDMYLFGHSYCCDTCLKKVNGVGVRNIYVIK